MPLLQSRSFGRTLRFYYNKLPAKWLGEYRILPLFFVLGAGMEFTMIKWHVGEVNFYKTYKKRRIQEAVDESLRQRQAQGRLNTPIIN